MSKRNSLHVLDLALVPIAKCRITLTFEDCFHGVSHYDFLENVADLSRNGGFLGSCSLMPQMEEAQKMISAYHASKPNNSIVTSSVVSAVEVMFISPFYFKFTQGQYGNYHSPHTKNRTNGSQLYISPLMSMYWFFSLPKVAERVLYIDQLTNTTSLSQIRHIINEFRAQFADKGKYIGPREIKNIPY